MAFVHIGHFGFNSIDRQEIELEQRGSRFECITMHFLFLSWRKKDEGSAQVESIQIEHK